MSEEPKPLPIHAFLDAVLLLAFSLAVYLLLGQDTFYKADGQHLVRRLIDNDSHYAHHKLYMPLLIAFGDLVSGLGMTPYRTAVVFSSVGASLSVCFVHLGFRVLRMGRGAAWIATGLFALCPAPLLFATVVEFHAPFLAFASVAFLETAFLVRRPSLIGGVFTGVFCAIAAGVHASGLILPGLLLLWFLALRVGRGTLRRDLLIAGVVAVVHFVLTRFLAAPDKANEFLAEGFGHPQGVEHLPMVVWEEFLWAFAPLSVAAFAAFGKRELRLQVIAFALATCPYIYGALRLLVGDSERGAYLLPLAIPAAWLTVKALPRKATLVALAVTAGLGITQVWRHDRGAREYRPYADGARAATDDAKLFLLLGDPWEFGPCLVYLPTAKTYLLDVAANMPKEQLPVLFPVFDKIVREEIGRGRRVLLTEGGERYLADPKSSPTGAGKLLLMHVEQAYRLQSIESGRFRAKELIPK